MEKEQVLSIIIDETEERVPIYTGTGYVNTKDTIRQSGMAKSLGTGVLSTITPSFAAASQGKLYEYYRTVAEAADMPIVFYNIPARTGNSLTPATVTHPGKIGNIVGAKDSSESSDNMLQYIEQIHESGDFTVLSGNDSFIPWNLLAGGIGGTVGCANIFPEVMAPIYDPFVAGDLEGAGKAQGSIRSLRTRFKYGNPNVIVKTTVAPLGYPVGKCRVPSNQAPEEGIEALEKVLAGNHGRGMC